MTARAGNLQQERQRVDGTVPGGGPDKHRTMATCCFVSGWQ
ncbi:hypothetical protein HMF8227_02792 [Saliniradius amylolyticus]|uniref:Uncharacterized protein n=1 Tax=Saliniradius amylolyticus TaxID=2183582 RepID=A0A2S2E6G8_9ALTE|nr:hypothetical protein [Saliniradius amylolyticus]AWL13241.1 hypothetical protein HMF8227_02792 [Saliniradius amylolyticus]